MDQEEEFWGAILEQLEGYTEVSEGQSAEKRQRVAAEAGGEVGLPLLGKGKTSITGSMEAGGAETTARRLNLTPKTAAISQLRKAGIPLIVDDFHYMNRDVQGNVVRALKPLIFEGVPVVIIAIPHRRYDAVKVEREMTGRLELVEIPTWALQELIEIPTTGFPLLQIEIAAEMATALSREAYGSPHLMQEFCREVCRDHEVDQTLEDKLRLESSDQVAMFQRVAERTNKVVFDRLSRGPRQRSDRKQRLLKSGGTADIYEVILLALAALKPGLDTINYEVLRGAIREVMAEDIPQAHEVTRVLEKMAEIAASDEASIAVVDWEKDEQKLHITDPFFAYYLKWGLSV